jgi:hypothetical protein
VNAPVLPEPVIERAEVVSLLFNVSDIVSALERIERLLEGDDGEEEADEG